MKLLYTYFGTSFQQFFLKEFFFFLKEVSNNFDELTLLNKLQSLLLLSFLTEIFSVTILIFQNSDPTINFRKFKILPPTQLQCAHNSNFRKI